MTGLLALKTELLAGHPDTGVYAVDSQVAADQINFPNRTIQRDTLSGSEIFESIDMGEFSGLTAPRKERIQLILKLGDVIKVGPSSNARAWLLDAFAGGSDTRANLVVAVSESVGRARELNLGRVRAGEIERARAL